ncbi:methylthioribose-1-phosphate isomerase, partial [miscellaneous Crenarchaeota group archaeon SMTZ1-55]
MRTVWWDEGRVRLINQQRLPGALVYVTCEDYHRVATAITTMEIRGAPAIGVAAALALALAAHHSTAPSRVALLAELTAAAAALKGTRPT